MQFMQLRIFFLISQALSMSLKNSTPHEDRVTDVFFFFKEKNLNFRKVFAYYTTLIHQNRLPII